MSLFGGIIGGAIGRAISNALGGSRGSSSYGRGSSSSGSSSSGGKYTWQETYDLARSQGLSEEQSRQSANNWANMGGKDRPATPSVTTSTPRTSSSSGGRVGSTGTTYPSRPVVPRVTQAPITTTPSVPRSTNPATLSYGLSLRDWGNQQGYGVSYDPNTGKVIVGNKSFQAGSIPGTILNSETGQHIITDSDALMRGMGGVGTLPNPMASIDLNTLLAELYKPAPTMEEMMAQFQEYVPEYVPVPVLSYDEAFNQASGMINPMYEISTRDLLGKLAQDQISRGFYGQLPADVITNQSVAALEANRNADIARQANELVGQSQSSAQAANELAMEGRGQSLNALIEALSNSQTASNNRLEGLLTISEMMNNNSQFDRNYALQQRQLELDIKQLEAQTALDQMNAALNRTDILGYVLPQDADLLGVAAGTASWQAREAAADRQAQLSMAAMGRSSGGSSKLTAAERQDIEDAQLKSQMQGIQAQYGCNPATALAILGVWDNPTRSSALADLESSKAGFADAGIDYYLVKQAVNEKWVSSQPAHR